MNSINSCALICVKDELNIEYVVSKIEYELNDDGSFKYIFEPYYDVIDLLDSSIFQGIPGLDLDLRNEIYIRDNIIPTFISERVPSENREDYYELLESLGFDFMDPLKYLIKSKNKYSGDNFYLIEYENRKNITLEENSKKSNSFGITKIILNNLAHGNEIILNDGTKINNNNQVFNTLKLLYKKNYSKISAKQKEGIKAAQEKGSYKGRKPITVDEIVFLEQYEKVLNGEITSKEAARNLEISIDKFYRFKKEMQK